MFLSRSPCIPPLYTKPTLSVCTTLDTVPRFRFHLSSLLVELINYRETTLHFFCPVFSARVTQIDPLDYFTSTRLRARMSLKTQLKSYIIEKYYMYIENTSTLYTISPYLAFSLPFLSFLFAFVSPPFSKQKYLQFSRLINAFRR